MLIAIVDQARKDASKGRGEAQDFIDSFLGGWDDTDRRIIPSKTQCRRRTSITGR